MLLRYREYNKPHDTFIWYHYLDNNNMLTHIYTISQYYINDSYHYKYICLCVYRP